MNRILFIILTFLTTNTIAQTTTEPTIFRITSSYTSFPDTGRANGHSYNKALYTTAEHYMDSSVLIVVPPKLKAKKQIDIVCWFHGWRNTIDSSLTYFELAKQFVASNRNAILVFAETAKDAPDSYGGKLEQKGVFKLLLQDVLNKLKKEKTINKKLSVGNVVLAGHSGAYRVISFILQNGNVEIKQTILFDALYGQVDKFSNWIQADTTHQLINIYTDNGGTAKESIGMAQQLRNKNIAVISTEEKEVNALMLKANNIIFIHTLKEHNDVLNRPDHNFRLFIENSHVLTAIN